MGALEMSGYAEALEQLGSTGEVSGAVSFLEQAREEYRRIARENQSGPRADRRRTVTRLRARR